MDIVSFKLAPALRRRLTAAARRRRVSEAAVIRESLEARLVEEPRARGELTCADLAGELIGSVSGPRDASTNRRYLEEAILSARRGRAKKRRR